MRGYLELLLSEIPHGREAPYAMQPMTGLWWTLETRLRTQLDQPITLNDLVRLSGRSAATLARASHLATGLPPLKRLKQVRLDMARARVMQTDQTMTQIAASLGFPRVHEFSRDYRKQFGIAPTHHRQQSQQT